MKDIALKIYRSVRRPINGMLNRFDPPVIVLLYHRVATLPADAEELAVTPGNFRTQLQFLQDSFPLVRFEDDWHQRPRPAVALTFDDGYADNVQEALPIIEEVGVPVTFFVSTGIIDTAKEFWWHEVERIILGGQRIPPDFTMEKGRKKKTWPTATDQDRRAFYRMFVRYLTDADVAHRDEHLSRLRCWARSAPAVADVHRAMTLEELRCLAESRWITIGAHTVTHTRLSSLPANAQQREIIDSKRQLETWLGREITVFSYPFGKRHDYTKATAALCREAGFTKAAANVPGQAHRWSDPYRIPRLLVRDWPLATFTGMLERFWTK